MGRTDDSEVDALGPLERGRHDLHADEGDMTNLKAGPPRDISLRDYFAAEIVKGWMTTYGTSVNPQLVGAVIVAEMVYRVADAMLAERDK